MLLKYKKATYVFTAMSHLLQQFKQRHLAPGLKQNGMMLRVGISRQQYQRLESRGNPRLDTLELIAKGLNSELIMKSISKNLKSTSVICMKIFR